MKPTRPCDWPPRLDVTLRRLPRVARPARACTRPSHAVHPLLRAVAQARWSGRPAKQRRFEKPASVRLTVA